MEGPTTLRFGQDDKIIDILVMNMFCSKFF
jgi:hypothetical protein